VHFSLAASFFTDVRVIGPVGDDFGEDELGVLRSRNIDTSAIEHVPGGSTFSWRGRYDYDLNTAHTEDTQLGVFGDFQPKIEHLTPPSQALFLANIQPALQRQVRATHPDARLVALDSMNLWIESAREELLAAIAEVDCVMLNDAELRMLTRRPNLVQAAREVMSWGPQAVVAKQGEYGAALFTGEHFFALPAFPLETVLDPTGAGDSFAGGFIGSIAAAERPLDRELLTRAMAYGTALASFNVEEFGTERVARLTSAEIAERVDELGRITRLPDGPALLSL
jgi:sugar/nucleoside kinase (ribokinase family)